MAEVRVRNLEPWVVEFLRDQARHSGRSLESYLRQHLREEAMRNRLAFADTLEARQAEFRAKFGVLSDSSELIRQDREERG